MPAGCELIRAGGASQLFSESSRPTRILRQFQITQAMSSSSDGYLFNGSVAVPEFSGGQLFAYFRGWPSQTYDGKVSISGNVVSWTGVHQIYLPRWLTIGECGV